MNASEAHAHPPVVEIHAPRFSAAAVPPPFPRPTPPCSLSSEFAELFNPVSFLRTLIRVPGPSRDATLRDKRIYPSLRTRFLRFLSIERVHVTALQVRYWRADFFSSPSTRVISKEIISIGINELARLTARIKEKTGWNSGGPCAMKAQRDQLPRRN